MATETITYDSTDDSVVIESQEARDQESLEIGEKMMQEQENLLAGKYRKPEDLEKAYLELQKKLGDQESEPSIDKIDREEESTKEEPTVSKEDFYTEDGSVNYDTTKQVYGEQVSNIFKENNIDPFKMNDYFMENNGTLSDEMYETLGNAGLNKSLVDSYLKGVRENTGYDSVDEAPMLTDAEIKEVHNIAGGESGYDQLMSWATDNLSDADCKNFDEVVETGNKAAVTFAVKALMGQYEDAVGRDSNLIQGKKAAPPETYRSMAEVVRDMGNPLYEQDEAYRDDVRRKLEASNLKV